MTKSSTVAAIALLASSKVDAFTLSPLAGNKPLSVRSRNVGALQMSSAEDEIAKLRAAAAKMREDAAGLEKVRIKRNSEFCLP